MKGIVKGLSRDRQRVAVETEYGYTVFDIEDGEADLEDKISGGLDDHGEQDLTNLTTGQTLTVYIDAIQASKKSALALCLHK